MLEKIDLGIAKNLARNSLTNAAQRVGKIKKSNWHDIIYFKDISSINFWASLYAEFIGTFLLVFIGCASVLPVESDDNLDNLIVPGLTFMAIIVTLIHLVGPTSGCHLNPAVTLALAIMLRCKLFRAFCYFLVQMLGAFAGALVLHFIAPQHFIIAGKMCRTQLNPNVSPAGGFLMELIATSVLILIVLVITEPGPEKDFEGFPALSAGITILALVYCAAPYTGASLNPARSFGPALVSMKFKDFWIYLAGPFGASFLGVFCYVAVFRDGIRCAYKKDVENPK